MLVECSDPLDDFASEEDRVRDRAVPEVVVVQDRRVALPGRRRLAAAVHAAPGHAVELGLSCEKAADVPEHVLLVGAVVVGKRDHVRFDMREAAIAGP